MTQLAPHEQLAQEKLQSVIAVLREYPALRDREMGETNLMGYLLDRCGMNHSAQIGFAYELQERCEGALPPYAIQNVGDLTLGMIAASLARSAWNKELDAA